MVRTLHGRLILSHVLLLFAVIPVMGLLLTYVLETQVLLNSLSQQLAGQAILIAEFSRDHAEIWREPAAAQALVGRVDPLVEPQMMLLDRRGRLLASSDPRDAASVGRQIELPGLAEAVVSGQSAFRVDYSEALGAEVAGIVLPVVDAEQEVVGVVRLTRRLGTVFERFQELRSVIVVVLAAGLLVGINVAWFLALQLGYPIRRVTQAVSQLASGQRSEPLVEEGPEETRLLARAFNSLVERLRSLEVARRRLLANLVHELARPLGALNSAIQALLDGADEDVALRRELLEGMGAEVRRLQRLLDDLTKFYDRILGVLELERRRTALQEWLPQVLAPWREVAQQKGLRWQVEANGELPVVSIDRDRMAQAVGNLLSNAIKYTPPGGAVSVETGREDGAVWLRVGDTGPGMSSDVQRQIFVPFYRGQTNRRFPQGMGLGLSIARDLVNAHGGRLEVESTVGEGSRFTIWLPFQS